MTRTIAILTCLLAAACASPTGGTTDDDPAGTGPGIGAESGQYVEDEGDGSLFRNLGESLTEHWRGCFRGWASLSRSVLRRTSADWDRMGDLFR